VFEVIDLDDHVRMWRNEEIKGLHDTVISETLEIIILGSIRGPTNQGVEYIAFHPSLEITNDYDSEDT